MDRTKQPHELPGEALIRKGLISRDQLNIALEQQQRARAMGRPVYLGEIIIRNNFATRSAVAAALSEVYADKGGYYSELDIGPQLCQRLGALILGVDGEALKIAAIRPLDAEEQKELVTAANFAGLPVTRIEFVLRDRMEVMLELGKKRSVDQDGMRRDIAALNRDPTNGMLLQELLRNLFIDALQSRASDVHIDNMHDPLACWIAYRIDGVMRHRYLLSADAMSALATRLKGEAGLDFSETQRPQDGRMAVDYGRRTIDLRVGVIPVDNGETLAIRLLDPSSLITLDDLMVHHPAVLQRLKSIVNIQNKSGSLALVTGPTGHGKSTSLYAMLRDMPRHKLNIMTAEDPVEYRMPGIRQTAVNRLTGLDYAAILVAQLRQDPDVLVIGEMRDGETVEAALRSVESGHMVLSTVHTNDVLQAINRLAGMLSDDYRASGLFVIAHYLKLIMNQRLARRLCQCAVPLTAGAAARRHRVTLRRCGIAPGEALRQPAGCPRCDNTGYFGRVLVPEFIYFPADRDLRIAMEKTICGSREAPLKDLLACPGVEYYSREEATGTLLRAGLIDLEEATTLLGLDVLAVTGEEATA